MRGIMLKEFVLIIKYIVKRIQDVFFYIGNFSLHCEPGGVLVSASAKGFGDLRYVNFINRP